MMTLDILGNAMAALGIMGKGMLGIFVVMILIMLIVFLMGKAGKQ